MKKLTFSLLSLLFIVLAIGFTACSDDTRPEVPEKDTLGVSPQTFTFKSADTSSQEFKVSKTADTYKAELNNPSDEWVKIDRQGESFLVTVDDYTDQAATKNREAVITVTSGTADPVTVIIYQEYPGIQPPPTLYDITLSQDELNFDGQGDLTKSVEVKTLIDYSDIDVVYEETWITSAELVEGELVVTVSENNDADRDGTITLKSAKATADAVLNVNQKVIPVLELEGTWEMTFINCHYTFSIMLKDPNQHSSTAVITYDEDNDYYLMKFEALVLMDYDTREVVLILHYDPETEEVTFEHGMDMNDFYEDESPIPNNNYTFIPLDDDMKILLPIGHRMVFRVSEDKKVLTPPSTLEYNDTEYICQIGYGRISIWLDFSRNGIEQGFFMENLRMRKID